MAECTLKTLVHLGTMLKVHHSKNHENDVLTFWAGITVHLHDLDLQMEGKNSAMWDLAAALCSLHHAFSNADEKSGFLHHERGGGVPCANLRKTNLRHTKKRAIKSGRWKGTVAVQWLFIHFVTIHL